MRVTYALCLSLAAAALCSCGGIGTEEESVFDAPDASSESAQDAIAQRKVIRGMTADEVILSWGQPRQINRSDYGNGIEEQWVYGDYVNSAYVYLHNGRVTAVQYYGYNPAGNAQSSSSGSSSRSSGSGPSGGGSSGSSSGGSGSGTGSNGGVFVD